MPSQDHLYEHIKSNAAHAKRMLQQDQHKGQTVFICGAGPSLAKHHEEIRSGFSHHVWGCNSALPYLKDRGLRVTHGFAIDQGIEMLNPEEWQRTFDVKYLIASSVHPKLVEHLEKDNRSIKWFHNYLGMKGPEGWTPPEGWNPPTPESGYEMWLYTTLFQPSVQVGYGLNSVPRAICLALWMGFSTIKVYGADCAALPTAPRMPSPQFPEAYGPWLDQVQLYADGRTARHYGETAVMVEWLGDDGRRWHTRADMVISAKHLVDLEKQFPDRVELIGDTLPNAIKHKPQEWFDSMPQLTGEGSIKGFQMVADPADTEVDSTEVA